MTKHYQYLKRFFADSEKQRMTNLRQYVRLDFKLHRVRYISALMMSKQVINLKITKDIILIEFVPLRFASRQRRRALLSRWTI